MTGKGCGLEFDLPRETAVRHTHDRVRTWSALVGTGGYFPNGGGSVNRRTTAFERAMPNVTMNYLDNRFEGEFYLGYYKVIRSEGGSDSGGVIKLWQSRRYESPGVGSGGWQGYLRLLALLGERRSTREQHVVDGGTSRTSADDP